MCYQPKHREKPAAGDAENEQNKLMLNATKLKTYICQEHDALDELSSDHLIL